jgi:hypothetical protein
VQKLHNFIICEETASEFLPYSIAATKIVQISAFLNSRDELLRCVGFDSFESADFQMSPSDIGLNPNIFVVNCYVLTAYH